MRPYPNGSEQRPAEVWIARRHFPVPVIRICDGRTFTRNRAVSRISISYPRFNIPMICSSLNRPFFIPFSFFRILPIFGPVSGVQVKGSRPGLPGAATRRSGPARDPVGHARLPSTPVQPGV